MTPINTWPKKERPREKLLTKGAHSLSDAELLAVFLRTGSKGKSVLELAREMLKHFDGLKSLLSADLASLSQFNGIGIAKYVQLAACMEMTKRYLEEDIRKENIFNHPQQVKQYIKSYLKDKDNEVFAVLFMDNQHRMIAFEELFLGTVTHSHVYPRVIMQRVLKLNAVAVILTHNHPSGDTAISQSDIQITDTLKPLLEVIDVRLLDHIIIASNQVISMAERGYI